MFTGPRDLASGAGAPMVSEVLTDGLLELPSGPIGAPRIDANARGGAPDAGRC
jgi:hypothetical protein